MKYQPSLTYECRCGNKRASLTHEALFGFRQSCEVCGPRVEAMHREADDKQKYFDVVRSGISDKKRKDILTRASAKCEVCGQSSREAVIEVGHCLSVAAGYALNLPETFMNSQENLAAMCGRCNRSYGAESIPARMFLLLGLVRSRAQERLF